MKSKKGKRFNVKLTLVVLLMLAFIGIISYGAFFVTKKQTNDNNIVATCFDTSFEEGASINLPTAYPLSEEEGNATTPYHFKITNKDNKSSASCTVNDKYYVILTVTTGSFNDSYVNYSLNGGASKVLNTADVNTLYPDTTVGTNSYIIDSGILTPGSFKEYDLRLWINSTTDYNTIKTQYGASTPTWSAEVKVVNNATSEKASFIKCIDSNGNDMTCPQTLEVGQRIAIGDEVFRFIRYTSTSGNLNECGGETGTSTACADATNGDIRALAEYNLYVGRIYTSSSTYTDITKASNPNEYGKQNSTAIGYPGDESYPRIGTTPFSSDSVKGTNYSSYTGSIVEDYVEEYVQYLSDEYDATVSGGLITKAELESLGCSSSSCSSSTYPWIYTTSYWSGSPLATSYVWIVTSDASFRSNIYRNDYNFGVRPVITISASDI